MTGEVNQVTLSARAMGQYGKTGVGEHLFFFLSATDTARDAFSTD